MVLHFGMTIYDLLCYYWGGKAPIYYFHHLLTIVGMWPFLMTGKLHVFASWAGRVELTNVPLGMINTIKRMEGMDSPIWGAVYPLCGVWALYLFTTVRSWGIGECLITFLRERPEYLTYVGGSLTRDEQVLHVIAFGVCFLLWALSVYWTIIMAEKVRAGLAEIFKKS